MHETIIFQKLRIYSQSFGPVRTITMTCGRAQTNHGMMVPRKATGVRPDVTKNRDEPVRKLTK